MKGTGRLLSQLRQSVDYWLSAARLEFTRDLFRIMKDSRISQSELARRMNTSQPYVSKALAGNSNFTLETMAKFAAAVGASLHVKLLKFDEWVEVNRESEIADTEAIAWSHPTTATGVSLRAGAVDAGTYPVH